MSTLDDGGDLTRLPATVPSGFQQKLCALEAESVILGGNTLTLSMWTGIPARTLALWLRGYEVPDLAEQQRVLQVVAGKLAEARGNTEAKP